MVRMRFLLAVALALTATAAAAHDYIVVASSDPAVPRGEGFDAGARVPLGAGRTATLMYASGDLVTLKGAAGGVVAPTRRATAAEASRLAALRLLIAPARNESTGSVRLARARSGVCPTPESLTALDDIAAVAQGGCQDDARTAFEAWLAAHLKP